MSGTFYNTFAWIAGVDKDTLDTCSVYERNKQTGFGTLILIPTLLGFISMSFSISILTDRWYVFISFGLLWALCIMFIDRFLIGTFRKKDKGVFWQFVLRLCLSIGLGIVVSHPLVLFIMDGSIQQDLSDLRTQKNEVLSDAYNFEYNRVNQEIDQYKKNNVDIISDKIDCMRSVRSAERSGQRRDINCNGRTFSTSGINTYGDRAEEYDHDINVLIAQRDSADKEYKLFKKRLLTNLDSTRQEYLKTKSNFNAFFSKDYASRNMALSRIMEKPVEGAEITNMVIFLLIFFIFLDILPFLLKVSTKSGEYDFKIKKIEETNIYLSNYDFDTFKDIESIKKENRYVFQKSKLFRMQFSDFDDVGSLDDYMKNL